MREFEQLNPELGKVVGTPVWVNKPPSESKIASLLASGQKPKKAGSVYFRLQSTAMVDLAVSKERIKLCHTFPTVTRGFPHLRVVQCWGCLRYGHTKSRCSAKSTRCANCGENGDHVKCGVKSKCVNCKGSHRADSFLCPKRKELALQLAEKARLLCLDLNSKSSVAPPRLHEPSV